MVSPADEHGDASADDVEARTVLLDGIHALLGKTSTGLTSTTGCGWRRKIMTTMMSLLLLLHPPGGGADDAGRVTPAEHGGTCSLAHGSAAPLLGKLPLLVVSGVVRLHMLPISSSPRSRSRETGRVVDTAS
jgi:hypothetical protein